MKKSELVTLVAEKTGFSKKDTEKTIDTVFTAIADIMAAGDKLRSILQRRPCRCSSRAKF